MPQNIEVSESPTPSTAQAGQRLHHWWSVRAWTKRTKIIASAVVVIVVILAGVGSWLVLDGSKDTVSYKAVVTPTPTPTPEPKDHPDPLNGVMYTATEAEAFSNLRPLSVMVENHLDARPQSGLNEAEVIYEAMAEGGITRFMAMYLAQSADKIGPVRSARLHYVSWAAEYDAAYAHWGGSAEALGYLNSHSRPFNLDQFKFAKAFYRDTSVHKATEHTGYTSVQSLRTVLEQNNQERASTFDLWTFKEDAVVGQRPASQTVKIAFLNSTSYKGEFDYRPETNDYARLTGGVAHVDAKGQQLTAKTIVLLYQAVRGYTDAGGHPAVDVTTIGSGRAVVIEDGVATEGRWSKASMNDRTYITDSANQPLALNRGKLWVVSVPTGSSVTY